MTQILTAKSMKVTIVLDPAEVARLEAPDGKPRVALAIRAGRPAHVKVHGKDRFFGAIVPM
jgi:3-dehydroquinate synthase class II